MQALSTSRNKYFSDRKNHTIFTAPAICRWLAKILEPELRDVNILFDPAVGSGNLLDPFSGDYVKIGADIENFEPNVDQFIEGDFLSWKKGDYPKVDLILINPPYNHTEASKNKWGRSTLLPELFVDQCFKLFGKDVKIVLFTPMGLRLNTRCYTKKQGERYKNVRDNWADITSIVSLPLDCFHNPDFDPDYPEGNKLSKAQFKDKYPDLDIKSKEVQENPLKYRLKSNIKRKETQQEILFFNMPKLKAHYNLPEYVIEELREEDQELWG